jgi:hypothetical protein
MTGVSNSTYTCYGGGFGFDVGGSAAGSTFAVPSTSTGITYALSGFPTITGGGMRINVVTGTSAGSATNTYCAPITSGSGTIAWTALELTCYDTPVGAALTGPPAELQAVQFSIDDGTASTAYNICVTSVTF